MAHVLSLVYGSTTVALASGDYRVEKYVPATPESGAGSVEETATILVTGSSLAALQADLAAINRAFERARLNHVGRSFVKVFVKFQASGESTTWLSEVYDGRVVMPESALQGDWANTQLEVGVIWSRAPFWEGDTWTAVPLTNGNGTDVTAGINVYNCNDAVGTSPNKRHNYVDIDGVNDIAGELPAPIKIRALVTGESSHFYFAHQADLGGLGLLQPWDEAEDFTLSGSTDTAEGASSGGYYTGYTLTAATEARFYQDIDLSAYLGGYHKFFVRFSTTAPQAPTDMKMKIEIRESVSGTVLTESQWVYATTQRLQEIGDVRMPPGRGKLPSSGAFENYRVTLVLLSAAGGAVKIDSIFWLPTESYVEIGTTLRAIDAVRVVYAEGFDELLYKETTGSAELINYFDVLNGAGIWLISGINQRVHFLTRYAATALSGIATYITLEMWYKPRRTTL